MLNHYITDIPEDERHRSSWLCVPFFDIIPRISVSINATSAVAIDIYPLPCDVEARVMILKGNWVGVVSPIIKIIGQLRICQQMQFMLLERLHTVQTPRHSTVTS